ncbi:RsmE family RNA methyltransferase [Tengunoibacter tsumagoiensis]|uniref:Ribosomal RNA small subunit methyltransferase E n=1 Tax=Tengunoibacter tsumagoiensis TaxID=2014871 RepID=A0A402A4U3_9CHLR|nr:RsmE family RNA methyltransferase [Tengunoibacter tsumagoiensis]GCE14079.1 RNA methyltransferase [Tengunoibacter tsumagoiensis]
MHRFLVTESVLPQAGETFLLSDKLAHQVRDVLHLKVAEHLILFDNSGEELLCTVQTSNRSGVEVQAVERRAGKSESPVRIVLCQGLLKSARFEWILEKGTELGVSTFAPIHCRRSLAGLEEAGSSKQQRWQRIIQEATEQCGRAHRPELLPIRSLTQQLQALPNDACAIIPWEEERKQSLQNVLRSFPLDKVPLTVYLFIGPEGGLAPEEIMLAQEHGVKSVSLGARILRAETAALAAVANVMYELEARLA